MIYLLVGPSGSGKSTLGSCLRDMDIKELISHSTRPMRKGEVLGNPYYFVTREQFKTVPMVEETEYNGNLYGTSLAEVAWVMGKYKDCFAIVDAHGVKAFREVYGELVKVIYIYAPSEVLIDRMRVRGDSEKQITSRIVHALATGEMSNLSIADYCIINKDLDDAVRQLKAIVGG